MQNSQSLKICTVESLNGDIRNPKVNRAWTDVGREVHEHDVGGTNVTAGFARDTLDKDIAERDTVLKNNKHTHVITHNAYIV